MTDSDVPLHIYRVPGFHEKGALVRDLRTLLIRADLTADDEAVLVDEAITRLTGHRRSRSAT